MSDHLIDAQVVSSEYAQAHANFMRKLGALWGERQATLGQVALLDDSLAELAFVAELSGLPSPVDEIEARTIIVDSSKARYKTNNLWETHQVARTTEG